MMAKKHKLVARHVVNAIFQCVGRSNPIRIKLEDFSGQVLRIQVIPEEIGDKTNQSCNDGAHGGRL